MESISRTIKDSLVQHLRQDIIRGHLVPGQRLRQDELAGQYGVSTMPIREALRDLEAEGLVTLTPHRTAEVTQLTADDLEDIYDMRIALEEMATRLAVPRLSQATLAHLEQCIAKMDDPEADVASLVWLNHDFHISLYDVAGRPHLFELLKILRHRTQHYLHAYITECGGLPLAQEEHRAIVAAARRGAAEEAGRLMRRHVAGVAQALIQHVRQAAPAGSARAEGS